MIKSRQRTRIISLIFVGICVLCAVAPIYWMVNTSLKSQSEIYSRIPTLFPENVTFDGYYKLFTQTAFVSSMKNSFLVAFVSAAFSVMVAFPVAYATARLKFKGRYVLSKGILITYMIPTSVLYIPLFMTVSKLGLSNSLWGLMLIYPTFALPYAAWMLIPHVRSVPMELEEAAKVDGCSRLRIMYGIVFPLAIPGIVTTFIFAFSMCWGEYLYALVNINSEQFKTYPLIISGLIFGDIYPWAQIMAGAVTACIPIFLLYILSSRMVVGGATSGGVKE